MPLKTERRTQHRKRPLNLVYVELPPSNGGMMRDISEQGFSLRAMMPVSPSEKVPFSFVLDSSARIDGEAIVLRVEDEGRVAALEFAGLSPHSRDQIRRWLEKFDEPISPEPSAIPSGATKNLSFTELRSQIRALEASPSAPRGATTATPQPPENEIAPPEPAPPPPQMAAEPPPAEPPRKPETPAAEIEPLTPLVVASSSLDSDAQPVVENSPPPPLTAEMSPPNLAPPDEAPADVPPLPPLLKLSFFRSAPPPAEISGETADPAGNAEPGREASVSSSIPLPREESEPDSGTRIAAGARPMRAAPRRRLPPALEPLSTFEGDADSASPGWTDRFTLGRAIGIMLFLTLLAGSYVYHREVGQALIWLGHQIEGADLSETSKVARPEIPAVAHSDPESTPQARVVPPPPLTIQQAQDTSEPKSASIPAASDKTPSPQIKSASPGALVPLTQVTRPPAPASPAENSVNAGQQEYLEALQILRSPNRAAEVPAAIQLLWTAVEKGNTGAEIDLAELFRTGRGVAKNCDQTRILLSAAARKGNAEARKRLEAFQREGCSN